MYTGEDPRIHDLVNWPYYARADRGQSELSERQLGFVRAQFTGEITMVDRWFGRVLEALDDAGGWDETMVVVTADHGHSSASTAGSARPRRRSTRCSRGRRCSSGASMQARTGERIDALTSTVDLSGTILDALGNGDADRRRGHSLRPVVTGERDEHRDCALYG